MAENYYCPECGTWFDHAVPFCTGPGESARAHPPAFVLKEGDTVSGSDAKGNEVSVTLTHPDNVTAEA